MAIKNLIGTAVAMANTAAATNASDGYKYKPFTYKDYLESEKVQQKDAAYNTHNAAKPADYQSKYKPLAEEAANAYANRDKFSYDLNGDALYQQYKDKYINQGRMAMQDTIGQASAMTGGYGNSYAATAGNQAYQASLQNLNDVVPQLYQMAYDQYNQEGQDMLNRYNLYNDMDNTDYGRYRDTVSDWTSQRDFLYNDLNNERTYDRGIYDTDRNFAYGTWNDDRNYNYQVGRDAVADSQWQKTFNEGVRQFNESHKASSSGSGGGGGNTKTWDVDDYHTVMYEAQGLSGDNDALDKYLNQMVTAKIITEEERDSIYEAYRVDAKSNPTESNPPKTIKDTIAGMFPFLDGFRNNKN